MFIKRCLDRRHHNEIFYYYKICPIFPKLRGHFSKSSYFFWRHIWKFFLGKWETFRTRQSVLFLIRQSKWSEEFQRKPILITLTLHAPPLPHNFLGIPLVLRFLLENVNICTVECRKIGRGGSPCRRYTSQKISDTIYVTCDQLRVTVFCGHFNTHVHKKWRNFVVICPPNLVSSV